MHIKTTKHDFFSIAEIEKEGAQTVAVILTVDSFSQQSEKAALLPYLYQDLLLSGADTYTRSEFLHALNALGASISISISGGKITITTATPKSKLKQTLELLFTALQKPRFAPSELKRAISTLRNNLELAKEDARGIAQSNLKNTFYTKADRSYDFSPDELIKALEGVVVGDIKNLHNIVLAGYWFVSIGGSKDSIATTQNKIKAFKKAADIRTHAPTVLQAKKATQVLLHEVQSKQNIDVSIGNAVPLTLTDPDAAAFLFGVAVLGKWGGFAGRLMSTVREKEGLTYGIYARVENMGLENAGYLRIMSFFAPKDVVKGITSTKREIKLLVEKGISQSEFERFKTIIKTGEVLVFDSLSGTTGLVHNNLVSGLSYLDYLEFRKKFQNCTRTQINAALKKYLNPNALVISAAGPIASVKNELLALGK